MKFRIYFDPKIGKTHLEDHNVSSDEVNEFFTNSNYFERKRKDRSFVAYGKLQNNRYLEFVYRKLSRNTIYIITGYDIEDQNKIYDIEANL